MTGWMRKDVSTTWIGLIVQPAIGFFLFNLGTTAVGSKWPPQIPLLLGGFIVLSLIYDINRIRKIKELYEPEVQEGPLPPAPPGGSKLQPMPTPNAGDTVAVMQTNHGRIVLGFLPDKAPGHVKNFTDLAEKGFYDGLKFHRIIPGFMIQGGCPNTRDGAVGMPGTGGPGYSINAEFNDVPHEKGILSMARSASPNSAGSQFFLMVAKSPHLDGQYSAFGYVIEGIEVADKIVALPRDRQDKPLDANPAIIESVKVTTWPLEA